MAVNTYINDLPEMVEGLLIRSGDDTRPEWITKPMGYKIQLSTQVIMSMKVS